MSFTSMWFGTEFLTFLEVLFATFNLIFSTYPFGLLADASNEYVRAYLYGVLVMMQALRTLSLAFSRHENDFISTDMLNIA